MGDGTQKEISYVLMQLMHFINQQFHQKGEIWNIGSGNPQSINKLVRLLKPIGIINLPKDLENLMSHMQI